jgi:hypothetical protein
LAEQIEVMMNVEVGLADSAEDPVTENPDVRRAFGFA